MAKSSITVTKFPILYKKSSTGAILQWEIGVAATTIAVAHGQVGGKIQSGSEKIKSGKNAGRKNATAPEEQALKEAQARWTKQKKSGYVESISEAQDGKTDSIIEGGIIPMLAKVYEDHLDKIEFPVAVQPKLDGHRCIAVFDANGKVSLWTRTRKPITSVPHIISALEQLQNIKPLLVRLKISGVKELILDGELYNHNLKDDFEKLTSAARKKEATEESKEIQYHVYDIVAPICFRERSVLLAALIRTNKDLELVSTKFSESEKETDIYFTLFTKLGYEGSMVRLLGKGYENKRSSQLLKVKSFKDEEFKIVGVEEGRGKLAGHAGAFVCETKDKKIFRAKMTGSTEKLKDYLMFADEYIGQFLTVKFQGLTGDGIPRFPVGLRIREDL